MKENRSVVVVGNGFSRKPYNVEKIKQYATVIGCNALYRDANPHTLVAVDRSMIREIEKNWNGHLVTPYEESSEKPYRYSGYLALKYAASLDPAQIFILGFDYRGARTNRKTKRKYIKKSFNIYANTNNYRLHLPNDNTFLERQKIEKEFFEKHSHINFFRVVDSSSEIVDLGIPNISKTTFVHLLKKGQ